LRCHFSNGYAAAHIPGGLPVIGLLRAQFKGSGFAVVSVR
tara:strand:+ start:236 stop:355 length:120 start_codon:yes stop_codon:yes gene_type:complete